jgi:hypothetical protein
LEPYHYTGRIYGCSPSNPSLLIPLNNIPVSIPPFLANWVWVLTKYSVSGLITAFNPQHPPTASKSLWIFQNGYITSFPFDLAKWSWPKHGRLLECNILDYHNRRGYRIALRSLKVQTPLANTLRTEGLTALQCSAFFRQVWHP